MLPPKVAKTVRKSARNAQKRAMTPLEATVSRQQVSIDIPPWLTDRLSAPETDNEQVGAEADGSSSKKRAAEDTQDASITQVSR